MIIGREFQGHENRRNPRICFSFPCTVRIRYDFEEKNENMPFFQISIFRGGMCVDIHE